MKSEQDNLFGNLGITHMEISEQLYYPLFTTGPFLEDSLSLVRSLPSKEKSIFRFPNNHQEWIMKQKFGKEEFKTPYKMIWGLDGNKQISSFLELYLSEKTSPAYESGFPNGCKLEIPSLGSVEYHEGNISFLNSIIFKSKGSLEIPPQKNLDELKSYYRGLKK